MTNKERALKLINDGFGRGDKAVIKELVAEDYVQHDPNAADGLAGLLAFVDHINQSPPEQRPVINVVRTLADGDLVAVHSLYKWGKDIAAFDVFRFAGGKAAEHWAVAQPMPAHSVSGRTMLDGPTVPTNLADTAKNKAIIQEFVSKVMIGGDFGSLPAYFDGERYLQHNAMFADGVAAVMAGMADLGKKGLGFRFEKLSYVIAEGDFVLTMMRGAQGSKPMAIYDLFRMEHGKIVEHWDVMQDIPPTSKNPNPMI